MTQRSLDRWNIPCYRHNFHRRWFPTISNFWHDRCTIWCVWMLFHRWRPMWMTRNRWHRRFSRNLVSATILASVLATSIREYRPVNKLNIFGHKIQTQLGWLQLQRSVRLPLDGQSDSFCHRIRQWGVENFCTTKCFRPLVATSDWTFWFWGAREIAALFSVVEKQKQNLKILTEQSR